MFRKTDPKTSTLLVRLEYRNYVLNDHSDKKQLYIIRLLIRALMSQAFENVKSIMYNITLYIFASDAFMTIKAYGYCEEDVY